MVKTLLGQLTGCLMECQSSIINQLTKMKNPQNGQFYLAIRVDRSELICVTWSDSGVCRAWHGYSDDCIGVAGGYGYDKTSCVLASAIEKLFNIDRIEGRMEGWERVKVDCVKHNIFLERVDYLAFRAANKAQGHESTFIEDIKKVITIKP